MGSEPASEPSASDFSYDIHMSNAVFGVYVATYCVCRVVNQLVKIDSFRALAFCYGYRKTRIMLSPQGLNKPVFRLFGLKYSSKTSGGKNGWCKSLRFSVG